VRRRIAARESVGPLPLALPLSIKYRIYLSTTCYDNLTVAGDGTVCELGPVLRLPSRLDGSPRMRSTSLEATIRYDQLRIDAVLLTTVIDRHRRADVFYPAPKHVATNGSELLPLKWDQGWAAGK
jgi:hypothetical protein